MPIIILSGVGIFAVMRLLPGNPAEVVAGQNATPAMLAAVAHQLGLDRPIWWQFWDWAKLLVHGNLGISYASDFPVTQLIGARYPATLLLALAAIVVAIAFGLASGIIGANHVGTWVDHVITAVNTTLLGLPVFWLGLMLILLFAVDLHLLPASGAGGVGSLILPAVSLALPTGAVLSRFIRTAILEVSGEQYVTVAHAKGLSPNAVLSRHVLRNALMPVITVLGLQAVQLLGGAIIVESVFGWPGIGRLLLDAVLGRDYPVVQGCLLVLTAGALIVNLLVDVSYAWIDPRVHYS